MGQTVDSNAGIRPQARPDKPHSTKGRHSWGVVLAGGDGTRLQPLTRLACGDNRPKQFCPLLGGNTLLAHTRQRISRTIDPDRMLYVLTKKHEPFYQAEVERVPESLKIVQPCNRGTLPAILWSLLRLSHLDPQALVAFFPADHYFGNEDAFLTTIETAFDFASQRRDSVVLLGAQAERPETEYGWIEPGCPAESSSISSFAPVRRFWEKPPLDTARELLARGCLWNTFVMVGSAFAFLEMIRHRTPLLVQRFEEALPGSTFETEQHQMHLVYDRLQPADFSREVLALSTERLLVASCGPVGWSDLGEPRRFISALTANDLESTWTQAGVCSKCGLTREQMVTLSDRESKDIAPDRSACFVPVS